MLGLDEAASAAAAADQPREWEWTLVKPVRSSARAPSLMSAFALRRYALTSRLRGARAGAVERTRAQGGL